ncbi:MAG: NosD domain-containing protein [Thermoplasmatota archaeon]
MRLKTSTVLLLFILVVQIFSSFSGLYTIGSADPLPKFFVKDDYNNNTPGWNVTHFNQIQKAIDKASEGDRIIVYAGTYNENIVINKTSLNVFGEDPTITIIEGTGVDNTVNITNQSVDFSGFTIKNSGDSSTNAVVYITANKCKIIDTIITGGNHGIYLNNCDHTTIYFNTIISNSGEGIYLYESSNNEITQNNINNNENGIFSYKSSNNVFYDNPSIRSNRVNGILLKESSTYNTITSNNISKNSKNGVYLLDQCNYNKDISNNDIYENIDSGIRIENSSHNYKINNNVVRKNKNYGFIVVGSYNMIQSCIISDNERHGLFLFADDNSTIEKNTIHSNLFDGIRLHNSTNNYIHTNVISDNHQYGIHINYYTVNSRIFNNFFMGNAVNARDISPSNNLNIWNQQIQQTNIIGQIPIYGNYWDDYINTEYPYSFNVSKVDEGALIDTTNPVIKTPIVTPESQILGGQTKIKVEIIDNVKLTSAFINITNPMGIINNYTIYESRDGDIFSYSQVFAVVGTYYFNIEASDSRNWAKSNTYSFNILSGIAPTIKDNSESTGEPMARFIFNATVTDDQDSAPDLMVYVNWTHGTKTGNYSLNHTTGDYFKRSITLDSTTQSLTYYLYSEDKWGNSVSTDIKTVAVIDTIPPLITIERFGPSFEDFPGSYTFAANIMDNCAVSTVFIEYWYGDTQKKTAAMDLDLSTGKNYYKKVIIPQGSPDGVYCVIYANDTSNNIADTKNPTAKANGPYLGVVAEEIIFNASSSFDLDGSITEHVWDFGDGITASGSIVSHVYSSSGNYTISLTVIDNDGNTNTDTTHCKIIETKIIKASDSTIEKISTHYNISLPQPFYCYDSTGDSVVDTFVDPNKKLSATHEGSLNLSGSISFLISISDDDIPEFIWHTSTNEIKSIVYNVGSIVNTIINEDKQQAILSVKVDKAKWIYIEIDDIYPGASLSVTTNQRKISSEFIWRKNNKVYVLDDPEILYEFIFTGIYQKVQTPIFQPVDGGIIDKNFQTIVITYNTPVEITYASFANQRIETKLITTDNKIFKYTPPSYLENGTYVFEIDAEAIHGTSFISSSVTYFYFSYGSPPKKSLIEQYSVMIFFGTMIGGIVAIFLILAKKQISIDHFLYIKNKKIIPFIKTIIFGPLSITIDEPEISKAEIYVDGQLKGTLTSAPFCWKWDEKAFMKHTLETKIFDEEGNYASSGEMEFYIFNNPLKIRKGAE